MPAQLPAGGIPGPNVDVETADDIGSGKRQVTLANTAFPTTSRPGNAFTIEEAGVAIVLVAGPCSGGYVTNGMNGQQQGNIPYGETFYVDPYAEIVMEDLEEPDLVVPGPNGTTSALTFGQTYAIPALAGGQILYGIAVSVGHAVTVVVYP